MEGCHECIERTDIAYGLQVVVCCIGGCECRHSKTAAYEHSCDDFQADLIVVDHHDVNSLLLYKRVAVWGQGRAERGLAEGFAQRKR